MKGIPHRTAGAVVLGGLLLHAGAAAAQDFDLQPTYQRFGVADVSATSGYQARVYLTTRGGSLVSKRIEQTVDGWRREDWTGFVSGVDAIHWLDGADQRVRVYSVIAGRVRQHIRDNDVDPGGTIDLPAAPAGDAVHAQTDVAAVTWTSGANRFIAVAAITNLQRLCVWESMNGGAFATDCSGVNVASSTSLDLDGAIAGTNPLFAFRTPGSQLGAARRIAAADYSTFNIGAPPGDTTIDPSVSVWQSLVDAGHVEIAVDRGTGAGLRTVRVNPSTGGVVVWTSLPAMPGGATPRVHNTTLEALRYNPGGGTRVLLYVVSSSLALYRLQSNAAGNLGAGTWLMGTLGQAASPPEEKWVNSGASAAVPVAGVDLAVNYGLAGEDLIIAPASATMVEARETGFRDHIRYQGFDNTEISIGDFGGGQTQWANESTISSLTSVGFATAIRRNELDTQPEPDVVNLFPWRVAVTQTLSGGDTFGLDQIIPVANGFAGPGPASMSDPFGLVDRAGTYHHSLIELPMLVLTPLTCNTGFMATNRRIMYRRGTFDDVRLSTAIDNAKVFNVTTAPVDHPTLAVTYHGQHTRPHVVWFNVTPRDVRHWFHNDATGTQTTVILNGMPGNPAGVIAGASGTLWAFSFPTTGAQQPTMCPLDPGDAGGNCTATPFLVGGAMLTPVPTAQLFLFPATGPMDPQATCMNGSTPVRCFDAEETFDVVADPLTMNRLFAVYQGVDSAFGGNKTSVFFTFHHQADPLGTWQPTVRVNSRSMTDDRHFIDPSITVDYEGTIVVTYSAIKSPSAGESAAQFVAFSTDNGATWVETQIEDTWNPAHLPWHCGRNPIMMVPQGNFFLGEYRDGGVRGGRAVHHFHASAGSTLRTVLRRAWASRWSVHYQY